MIKRTLTIVALVFTLSPLAQAKPKIHSMCKKDRLKKFILKNKVSDTAQLLSQCKKFMDIDGILQRPGQNALFLAIKQKNISLVNEVLNAGANANFNKFGVTPLIEAIRLKNLAIVKTLLNNKAKSDLATPYGSTPLMFGSDRGAVQIVDRLLDTSLDVDAKTKEGKNTALIFATNKNHHKTMELLLKKGRANPNEQNKKGHSAFLYALSKNSMKSLDLLLKHGANVNIENDGLIPLFYAASWGREPLVDYLLANGANRNYVNSKGKGFCDYISKGLNLRKYACLETD